jgi:hypothetical protein
MNEGRKTGSPFTFHLTYSSNHWSTLTTTKQFVEHIFKPYHVVQVERLALTKGQKVVWLIDC